MGVRRHGAVGRDPDDHQRPHPSVRRGKRRRGRIGIEVDDVEIQDTETRTALALHTLVTSRFRGDDLQLISFGRSASVMQIEQLVGLDARWDKGTNLHHALLLANRHFRKHPKAQPVLLIVTDGEPTSHLESSGEVFFSHPPDPVTIALAVRELDGSMRLGARTTFFRLGDDPGLADLVDAMARRVGGTVITPETDDLGAAVIGSYLSSRRNGAFGGWGSDEAR